MCASTWNWIGISAGCCSVGMHTSCLWSSQCQWPDKMSFGCVLSVTWFPTNMQALTCSSGVHVTSWFWTVLEHITQLNPTTHSWGCVTNGDKHVLHMSCCLSPSTRFDCIVHNTFQILVHSMEQNFSAKLAWGHPNEMCNSNIWHKKQDHHLDGQMQLCKWPAGCHRWCSPLDSANFPRAHGGGSYCSPSDPPPPMEKKRFSGYLRSKVWMRTCVHREGIREEV